MSRNTPEELSDIDGHSNYLDERGYLPLNFVVTDVQPAPNNYAGATVAVPHQRGTLGTWPTPTVLVEQNGHWLLDHGALMPFLDKLWWNTSHYYSSSGGLI